MAKAGYVGNQPVRESQAESYPGAWTGQEQYQEIKSDNWPKSVYEIERSVRINSADNAFFSRTPSSSGNRRTWTWSGWIKRSTLSAGNKTIFMATTDGYVSNYTRFIFATDNIYINHSSGAGGVRQSTAKYRDTSAWLHVVIALDTTQSTGADRLKFYVNGQQVTAYSGGDPALNAEWWVNSSTATHYIGTAASQEGFDGYLANIHLIDGLALTPDAFATTDPDTNQWVPKKYTNSYGYGTNGFWLKFADNSAATAATLGKDYSGNSNNWTPNNLSVTAGAGNDSLVDTPTSYGTDTGAGGEVRGNYATLNPLQNTGNTLSNGNLDVSIASTNWTGSTVAMTTGKWYTEFTVGSTGTIQMFGICNADFYGTGGNAPWITAGAKEVTYYVSDGRVYVDGVNTGTTSGASAGDIISFAFDADARSVAIRKNNTLLTTKTITASAAGYIFYVSSGGGSCTATLNYGARSFAYTAPSGFKALCTTNLPAPVVAKPSEVMDVKLYTGNGSTQTISGLGFSPDFVWSKCRNVSRSHRLSDAVRGSNRDIYSDTTAAESADGSITAFTSNGFNLDNSTGSQYNVNGETYVSWCFDAGANTVSNTAGSITTSLRASASSGFSVISYTGTGSAGASIGHGLGVAPAFALFKNRSTSSDWQVYHASLGNAQSILLQSTAAAGSSSAFNSTSPTSTVITLGAGTSLNNNGSSHICYAWAPVTGYSSFGSYTGNGSADGPFVFCNFRPRWIMIKSATETAGWMIYDTARDTYNQAITLLYPNLSLAEQSSSNYAYDIVSNGFKVRNSGQNNTSSQTYIYAAFAENPFQYARAR